jgi:hypothetical protein
MPLFFIYYLFIFLVLIHGGYDRKKDFLLDLIPFRRIFVEIKKAFKGLK